MHPTTQKLFNTYRYCLRGLDGQRVQLTFLPDRAGDWIRANDVRSIIQNEADAVVAQLAAVEPTEHRTRAAEAEVDRAEQAKCTKAAEAALVEQTKRATAAEAKLVELAKDIEVVDAHRAEQKQRLDCSWRHTQGLRGDLRRTECLLAAQRTRADVAEAQLAALEDELVACVRVVADQQERLDAVYPHVRGQKADLRRAELPLIEQTKCTKAAEAALAVQTNQALFLEYRARVLAERARLTQQLNRHPVDMLCQHSGSDSTDGNTWLRTPRSYGPHWYWNGTSSPDATIIDVAPPARFAPGFFQAISSPVDMPRQPYLADGTCDQWQLGPRCRGPHWYWSGARCASYVIKHVQEVTDEFARGFYLRIPSPTLPTRAPEGFDK